MIQNLVLSLFPGIDLLGRGFEAEDYCVVRGPDLIWGQTIEAFTPASHAFEGVIGGSPCQDFSKARRCPPTGNGLAMVNEFRRCVAAAAPDWWLLENVPGVPDVCLPGYEVQRFNLSAAEFGCRQRRLRRFQFGYRDGAGVIIARGATAREIEPAAMASESGRKHRRPWGEFCRLQGLPETFDLPGWSLAAKYRAVGNGVPIPVARAIALGIRARSATHGIRPCVCGCARPAARKGQHATATCRKIMERRRRDGPRQEADRSATALM